eukprot:1208115-Prymnesium_polylepis.1
MTDLRKSSRRPKGAVRISAGESPQTDLDLHPDASAAGEGAALSDLRRAILKRLLDRRAKYAAKMELREARRHTANRLKAAAQGARHGEIQLSQVETSHTAWLEAQERQSALGEDRAGPAAGGAQDDNAGFPTGTESVERRESVSFWLACIVGIILLIVGGVQVFVPKAQWSAILIAEPGSSEVLSSPAPDLSRPPL